MHRCLRNLIMKLLFKLYNLAWAIPCAVFCAPTWAGQVNPDDVFGPRLESALQSALSRREGIPGALDTTARLRFWNEQALNANAIDHTPAPTGSARVFGEQLGPTRTSRALAIVQIAVFDAVNAIGGRYPSYAGIAPAPLGSSRDAAIATAARDTLVALYPSQAATLRDVYKEDLERIPDGRAKDDGVETGRRAAAAILALRASDGWQSGEPIVGVDFIPSNLPGKWRPDPVSQARIALGAQWESVKPFVLPSKQPYQPGPPPALTSSAYTSAFNEVKQLGGDGITTPTRRTPEQTIAGIYWGYDGTPGLGTPPRLYNQIAVEIGKRKRSSVAEFARMLALVNVAMADTCMVVWDVKYNYQFWRPVAGIRESDQETGPSGLGDGNAATRGDPSWTPLGGPASNLVSPNFTPAFPAYPSGHAAFGSALFETLRRVYGTDQIAFTFVSDEYNGVTHDNRGAVRPRLPRGFATLSQAEEENGQSRIYLGIHWAFDKTGGYSVGRRVADYIFQHGLVHP
jgi:hypothetical protein